MSRTPEANVSKLPKWAQALIEELQNNLCDALEERDEALSWCDNFEYVVEDLTKQLEERSNKRHEDTPNTICSDRRCCPLALVELHRPL